MKFNKGEFEKVMESCEHYLTGGEVFYKGERWRVPRSHSYHPLTGDEWRGLLTGKYQKASEIPKPPIAATITGTSVICEAGSDSVQLVLKLHPTINRQDALDITDHLFNDGLLEVRMYADD